MSLIKVIGENIRAIILGSIMVIVIVSIFNYYMVLGTIRGASMYPTLVSEYKVIGKRRIDEFTKGKIYCLQKDNNTLIKRLIAVGGEHIVIKDKDVYVNGELLNEQYVVYNALIGQNYDIDVVVPKNKLFFIGDNRSNSSDSRAWDNKFIDENDVLAEVGMILYPFNKIGKVK